MPVYPKPSFHASDFEQVVCVLLDRCIHIFRLSTPNYVIHHIVVVYMGQIVSGNRPYEEADSRTSSAVHQPQESIASA